MPHFDDRAAHPSARQRRVAAIFFAFVALGMFARVIVETVSS